MPGVVLDTHALVWYLTADRRLPSSASGAVDATRDIGEPIYVSAMSLLEIVYLGERGRITSIQAEQVLTATLDPGNGFTIVPLDAAVVRAAREMTVRELPDRVIAATGRHLGAAIVTRDEAIRASGVPTQW